MQGCCTAFQKLLSRIATQVAHCSKPLAYRSAHWRSLLAYLWSAYALALVQPAAAATLDLSEYRVSFDENFSHLDVSSQGPGTRWIAHTPWHGDFGDAQFVDPGQNFPFTTMDGSFVIELRKDNDGRWRSGLLASVDGSGHGFAQQYGYFEMRAKLPRGPGLWPAFWLDSQIPDTSSDPSVEIDVIEQYGQFPAAYNSTLTVWPKAGGGDRQSAMHINNVPSGVMSSGFHTYGVLVGRSQTIFYFDRNEVWRTPTPAAHRHPLMILVDLGLGGGWPTDKSPSPAFMSIDYIRAYIPVASHETP
jgi:hypothetical protein